MSEFDIEILQWAKYQHRKDLKSMTWFRVEGTIFFDKGLCELGVNSKLFWFWLMSEACRANAARVQFKCSYSAKVSGIRANFIHIAVNDLERLQLVKVHSRPEFVTYGTKQNKTNNTEQDVSNALLTKNENGAKLVAESSQIQHKNSTKKQLEPSKSALTWECYSRAYRKRYGVDPVRNRTINSQLKNFVERIGENEAPEVAAYYVMLNDPFYSKAGHSIGIMLRDAEKLRTMCLTGRRTTAIDPKTAFYQEQIEAIERGEV